MEVTGEQVKAAALAANITRVEHHPCSICDCWCAYIIEGDELFFDASCGCGSEDWQRRSWDAAADWINTQTEEAHRSRIMKAFGFAAVQIGGVLT